MSGAEPSAVEVSDGPRGIVVTVRGSLDVEAARLVCETVSVAMRIRPANEVEIDLREMDAWTTSGLRELDSCMVMGVRFRMGPHAARTA